MATKQDIAFIRELVSIDTTTKSTKDKSKTANNYEEIVKHIVRKCEELGADVQIVSAPIEEIKKASKGEDDKPRPNIIARIKTKGATRTLALNAHYDAVAIDDLKAWKVNSNPFELKEVGNKIYGRGTNDDKGAIAAIIGAVREAKNRKANLELFFTCDEEVASWWGMRYVLDTERENIKSTYAVVVDGHNHISIGTSGGVDGKIIFKGKGGHAGYPFLAKNPIEASYSILQELTNFKGELAKLKSASPSLPGIYTDPETNQLKEGLVAPRFSVTVEKSGDAPNNIPNEKEVQFDLRVGPGFSVNEAFSEFEKYFEEVKRHKNLDGITIELSKIGSMENGSVKPDSWIVETAKELLNTDKLYHDFGGNDSAWFNNRGIDAISYGLFNESAHQPDEFLDLEEFDKVKNFLIKLIERP